MRRSAFHIVQGVSSSSLRSQELVFRRTPDEVTALQLLQQLLQSFC